MDALKNATFLADDDQHNKQVRNHFLDHTILDQPSTQITVMAFQHLNLPLWGVQFHPESVSTEHGQTMISNFQQETVHWISTNPNRSISTDPLNPTLLSYSAALPKLVSTPTTTQSAPFELYIKSSCPSWIDPDVFVDELLSTQGDHTIGWLDSSRLSSPYSRLSILSLDPAVRMTYSTLHHQLTLETRQGQTTDITLDTTFFDYLSQLLIESKTSTQEKEILPQLEFQGGLMGYFGYEMKRESLEGYKTPTEQLCHCPDHGSKLNCCTCLEEPDAAFQFVDRFLVFDQTQHQIYLCCLIKTNPTTHDLLQHVGFNQPQEAKDWIQHQEQSMLSIVETIRKRKQTEDFIRYTPASSACTTPTPSLQFTHNIFDPDVDHEAYLKTIKRSVEAIREGEAYEICLTTRFRLDLPKQITTDPHDPTLWRLYTRHLRKNNPAPFSALLMFPNLGLLSSSPERFLKVSADGLAEMKPIKGTVGRVLHCVCDLGGCDFGVLCEQNKLALDEDRKQQLWQDVKERAENLMVRNKKKKTMDDTPYIHLFFKKK